MGRSLPYVQFKPDILFLKSHKQDFFWRIYQLCKSQMKHFLQTTYMYVNM
jgi:hypothetical protein